MKGVWVRKGRKEGEPLSIILRRKHHHLEKCFTYLGIFLFILVGWTLKLGWTRPLKNKTIRRRLNIIPKIIFLHINRIKKTQEVLRTKSRTESEWSLYSFAPVISFNVTGRVGNTLVGTDGGQLSSLALFAQVVCHGREGPVPHWCGTVLPEAALTSSRAQGQAGRGLCRPPWLPCLSWLHPILFTTQIKISSSFHFFSIQ